MDCCRVSSVDTTFPFHCTFPIFPFPPFPLRIILSLLSVDTVMASGLPNALAEGQHIDLFSVARVRPRTSKGITDLLLLNLVQLRVASPSKKNGLLKREAGTIHYSAEQSLIRYRN